MPTSKNNGKISTRFAIWWKKQVSPREEKLHKWIKDDPNRATLIVCFIVMVTLTYVAMHQFFNEMLKSVFAMSARQILNGFFKMAFVFGAVHLLGDHKARNGMLLSVLLVIIIVGSLHYLIDLDVHTLFDHVYSWLKECDIIGLMEKVFRWVFSM